MSVKDDLQKQLDETKKAVVNILQWIKDQEEDDLEPTFPAGEFLGIKFEE